MIPLMLEEYFDMEVCSECQNYTEEPVYCTLPDNRVIGLCGGCHEDWYQYETAGTDYETDTSDGYDGFCGVDTPTQVLW